MPTPIPFGGELHQRVERALAARIRLSFDAYADRNERISESEEQFQAYVKVTDVDNERKKAKKSQGVQDFVTLEVPYSYAAVMTAHTYYTSVFLARDPIFQVQGRHGEAEMQTQAIEALLSYQVNSGMNLPQLFCWLLDPGKTGLGVVGHYWDEEMVYARRYEKVVPTFMGMPIPGAKPEQRTVVDEIPGYRGNKLFNVRPQDWINDPRVSLINFQQGEFCGRYVELSWNELTEGERRGEYVNLDVVKKQGDQRSDSQINGQFLRDVGSANVSVLPNENAPTSFAGYEIPTWVVRAHEMYVRLYPADWGLDNSAKRPEVWVFTRTTSGVVIRARPTGLFHGRFPFDVLTSEPDAYNLFSPSMMERSKPLNDTISWLLNSHFYNVRAALNNQFIFDPSRVVVKDVEDPRAGKLIRLKPEAYGSDVRTVLGQLQVGDVTAGHLGNIQAIEQILQRTLGVNDNVMGAVNSGGRKTATEIRSATSFSINRLKTNCEWFSATGFGPLTQKLIQTSQQNFSYETKLRVVGDVATFAPMFADVNPEAIAGFYDFIPVDGTMPVDRFAQANLWQMMLGQVMKMPQIAGAYDLGRVFAWVANLAGLRNIQQFRIQPGSPEAIQQQVQAGNVVPMKGNLNEPGQVPMMGQTG